MKVISAKDWRVDVEALGVPGAAVLVLPPEVLAIVGWRPGDRLEIAGSPASPTIRKPGEAPSCTS